MARSRAMARRWLIRLYPAVYAVGHGAIGLDARLTAALWHGGPGAALSRTTAGWWWEVIDVAPRVIHVDAPVRRRGGALLRVHCPRTVESEIHRGLPVTPVPTTLLALAATLDFEQLRRAVAEADHRGLLDLGEVERVLGRGRRGSAALRRALKLHLPELADTASRLEERFLALLAERRVPLPEVNVAVGRFKVDCAWRDRGLIVELDGHATHARPAAAERDRQRDLELRAMGQRVLRYTWQQVHRTPDLVVADLRSALDAPPSTDRTAA